MNFRIIIRNAKFSFVMLSLSFVSHAQDKLKDNFTFGLTGVVLDKEQQKPLKYATISIYSLPDSSLVQGTITNKKGEFDITNLKSSQYFYKVEFLGFLPFQSESIYLEDNIHLQKPIKLQLDVKEISEVKVIGGADYERVELDKTVYNVSRTLVGESGSANDVLATIPKLDVNVNGDLRYRGSSNVKVLIDGKLSQMLGMSPSEVLSNLPAVDIDRVEIISNPSVKYDASGSAGIVNIILKKERAKGFNGNASVSLGTKDKFTGQTGLNLRTGKFNFTGSYNYANEWNGRDYVASQILNEQNYTKTDADIEYGKESHLGKLGVDYLINDKNTLSFALTNREVKQNWNGDYNYTKSVLTSSTMAKMSQRKCSTDLDFNSLLFNLSYIRKFARKDQELSVDAAYTDNSSIKEGIYRTYENSNLPSYTSDLVDSERKEGLIQLDYKHPVGEVGALEAGYMFRSNEIKYRVPRQVELNFFDYKETVQAAYSQFTGNKGDFGYQLGIRAEYSDIETSRTYNDDYLDIFPSLHLSYKLSENKEMQLSYSKMIYRPNSAMINPFQNLADPLNQRLGTTTTAPYYSHQTELVFSYEGKKITYTAYLYYQLSKDIINQFREIDEEGNSVVRFRNIGDKHFGAVEFNLSFKLNKWWRLNYFITGTYHRFASSGKVNFKTNDDFGYFGRITSTVRIPKLFTLQAVLGYESEMPVSQGSFDPLFYANCTLAKRIMKKKAVVSLSIYDVFDTKRFTANTSGNEFSHQMKYKYESRIANLTFRYYFGKKYNVLKSKKRNCRTRHSEKDI